MTRIDMRIGCVDEHGRRAQIELGRVNVGDRARFVADFQKLGPRFEKDEVGEIVGVMPETLVVRAMGHMASADTIEVVLDEVEVSPEDIILIVSSEDPRIGNHRVSYRELQEALGDVNLGSTIYDRRRVAAVLTHRGKRRMARIVLDTSDDMWQSIIRQGDRK